MSKQVIVTGASSFIGKKLTMRLIKEKFLVIVIIRKDSDISYLESDNVSIVYYDSTISSLEPAFNNKKIDAIFHLAAWSNLQHNSNDIEAVTNANICLGTQLLQCAYEHKCNSFINTSSFLQYNNSSKFEPQSLYAATKRAFEDIIEYYSYNCYINAITLVLSDVYGTDDHRKKIFSLLKDACVNSSELDTTAGEQFVRPVYIDDVVEAYMRSYEILQSKVSEALHEKYFIAGDKIQLKELIKKYITIAQYDINKINIGKVPYPKNQIMDPYVGDILPGWNQTVSIDEGLRKVVNE